MKVQFSTGAAGAKIIEQHNIPGLAIEDGLVTVSLGTDRAAIEANLASINAALEAVVLDLEGRPEQEPVKTLKAIVAYAGRKTLAEFSAPQTEVAASEEAVAADTGSHSLPTGDESTSDTSQANSDASEEQDENGNETQRKVRRSRD